MCLIEWAEKGWGLLAKSDVEVNIKIDSIRNDNRLFEFVATSDVGERLLYALKQ